MLHSFATRWRARHADYDALPFYPEGGRQPTLSERLSRRLKRRTVVLFLATLAGVIVVLLVYVASSPRALIRYGSSADIKTENKRPPASTQSSVSTLPPLYPEFHQAESRLPQHSYEIAFKGRKFISVASHMAGMTFQSCPINRADWILFHRCGIWELHARDDIQCAACIRDGAVVRMSHVFFGTHISRISFRFAFHNYTWSVGESEYSDFNGKVIPSRIPLSALISGELRFSVRLTLNEL